MGKLTLKVNDVFSCMASCHTATITSINDGELMVSCTVDNEPDLGAIDVTLPLDETLYGFECGEYIMKP